MKQLLPLLNNFSVLPYQGNLTCAPLVTFTSGHLSLSLELERVTTTPRPQTDVCIVKDFSCLHLHCWSLLLQPKTLQLINCSSLK